MHPLSRHTWSFQPHFPPHLIISTTFPLYCCTSSWTWRIAHFTLCTNVVNTKSLLFFCKYNYFCNMISSLNDTPCDPVVVDMNEIKSDEAKQDTRSEVRRGKWDPDKAEHDEDSIGEIWILGIKEVQSAARPSCFRLVHRRTLNHTPRLLIFTLVLSFFILLILIEVRLKHTVTSTFLFDRQFIETILSFFTKITAVQT